VQCIPLHQPGRCPADGLTGLWGLTIKAKRLSAYLPQALINLLLSLPILLFISAHNLHLLAFHLNYLHVLLFLPSLVLSFEKK